ncbi:MAG: cysteinyl-tRNA synthetase, partial [Thermoproteota archaeon]|nr:cysteinyl-tRNA synthetase [Thermoproteota archaeon]
SLGNFITINDILKKYEADALRLFIASTYYRSPIDYSDDALEQSTQSLRRIRDTLDNLSQAMKIADSSIRNVNEKIIEKEILEVKNRFLNSMDDDFNTAKALAAFFELIKIGNVTSSKEVTQKLLREIYDLIIEFGGIIGLHLERTEKLPREAEELIAEREIARKNKDWKKADEIRKTLRAMGIILQDYPSGTTWSFEREEEKK